MVALVRSPQVTNYPGTPGQPARSAHSYWAGPVFFQGVARFDRSSVRIISGDVIDQTDDYILINNPTYEILVRVPARPAIPASEPRTVVSGASGWSGGARTIEKVGSQRWAEFNASVSVAVTVGLARPGSNYSYAAPNYSWRAMPFEWGGFSLFMYKGAQEVGTYGMGFPGEEIADFRMGFRRQNGLIVFTVDGFDVHTEPDPGGEFELYATPYTVGDSVTDVEINPLASRLEGTLPALTARLGDLSTRLDATLPAMTGQIVSLNNGRINATLPAMTARLGDINGRLSGTLPAIGFHAVSEPTFEVVSLYAQLPAITCTMRGIQGSAGSISSTLPAVTARLGEPVGRIRARMPISLIGRISSYAGAPDIHTLSVGDFASIESAVVLVSMSYLEASAEASLTIVMELSSLSGLEVMDSASFGSVVEMLAMEEVLVNSSVGGDLQREALQYAVNVATGALSRYEGFDYNGFAAVGDKSYAWRADGLYRLGQSAEMIDAMVDLGLTDFGAMQLKRADMVWVGIRTDGCVYLKVAADGQEPAVYRVTDSENCGRTQMAKGVTGRHWHLQLELEDASFAALDSIEINVAVSQRKLNRRRS